MEYTVRVAQAVYDEVTSFSKPQAEILKQYLKRKVVNVDLSQYVIEDIRLHKGELSSIALNKHLKADYLLIDEKAARRVAKLNQINVIGSLGVLIEAKERNIIPPIKPHIEILKSSQIYFSQDLLDHALRMVKES